MAVTTEIDKYERIEIREGDAPYLRSRVADAVGTALLKSDISSISFTVTNMTTGVAVTIDPATLDKAVVWSDTLLTTGWYKDATGYNFFWQTEAEWFVTDTTDTTTEFRIEVRVTRVTGPKVWGLWVSALVYHSQTL